MKRFIVGLAAGFLLCFYSLSYAEEIKLNSQITAVTVYGDRALITRQGAVRLGPGTHNLIFEGLPGELLEDSLRVSLSGTAAAKVFGTEVRPLLLAKAAEEKVRELREQIQQLEDQDRALKEKIEVWKAQKDFLMSIKVKSQEEISRDLSKDFSPRRMEPKDWKQTLGFFNQELNGAYEQIRASDMARRELAEKLKLLKHELSKVQGERPQERKNVQLTVEAAKPGEFTVDLAYVMHNAAWSPAYDVHFRLQEKDVDLTYYGEVRQKTGEAWDKVQLTLSTAKPAVGGNMPPLNPWYLSLYEPHRYDEARPKGAALKAAPAPPQAQRMMVPGAKGGMEEEEEAAKPAEVITSQVETAGTAVVFKARKTETLPSDGSAHKTVIARERLGAVFTYESTPKLSAYAYLKATVVNQSSYPLLAGPVQLFAGQDFVGKSQVATVAPTEKFALFLGVDEGIKVKREEIKKEKGQGGLVGKTHQERRAYRLTIENHKKEKVQLVLHDQIPVAQNQDITVKILNMSDQTEEDKQPGHLKWRLNLDPGAKKEITFEFLVEYPEGMNISGI
jgi:uncharacterized protein (TIGR02231 family)